MNNLRIIFLSIYLKIKTAYIAVNRFKTYDKNYEFIKLSISSTSIGIFFIKLKGSPFS
ncbi:hypothetical protein SAMN02745938_11720 [Flavobacterium psychrophilum DSM 3660]|nr:hypothetical protein SAMN02745938_11720 [Flavobacterium psychrophilum DSM 3660] [Flavobacterium psychrophilum DSM 3660 = ATCC 49418]